MSALTSTITSSSTSSSNFFEHSNHATDIKVIELKHSFNDGEYCPQTQSNDSDSDGDESDESDDSDDSDDSDGDDENDHENNNKVSRANSFDNNHVDKQFDADKNRKTDSTTSLKRKLKEEEEHHPSTPLDISLKNMPVNMLRDLAKTKLTHLEQPTINKMSKKEILKALDI